MVSCLRRRRDQPPLSPTCLPSCHAICLQGINIQYAIWNMPARYHRPLSPCLPLPSCFISNNHSSFNPMLIMLFRHQQQDIQENGRGGPLSHHDGPRVYQPQQHQQQQHHQQQQQQYQQQQQQHQRGPRSPRAAEQQQLQQLQQQNGLRAPELPSTPTVRGFRDIFKMFSHLWQCLNQNTPNTDQ